MIARMSWSARVRASLVLTVAVTLAGAAPAHAQQQLESPSLMLLIASLAQLVLAAGAIVFWITRSPRTPSCPRCGMRLTREAPACPRCGGDPAARERAPGGGS